MIVKYSVINQAWVILFGDNLIDLDGRRIFTSYSELEYILKTKGLVIGQNGVINHG